MSIQVEHLTKIFGEQKAVNQVSFSIENGVVGFLGPNGAGKSTTMKMLSTYISPSAGKALVCGYDVARQSMEVRRNVGYLPESNPLYYDMYVREYLEFAAGVHQLGSRKKSRIDEMIVQTGLQKEIKKKIGALSKGYKQRVGLAQAMIHDPRVLILDEPTSGLDPNQIMDIRDLIINLGKDKTVLLSTHIMQEVQAMCSRVIIINNGTIVADDAIGNIQSAEKPATGLLVEFDRPVDETALRALKQVRQLKQVEQRWLLETTQPEALRKELMTWSLQNDIAIVSLQNSSQSLEEAFRDLTRGK
ncbi:gliding motility-associated ABC transporter ATP-binding subunit GldA [Taibaiella koreensis]|uniref:gliding motility-associated ABC transporter ATP-binding subunit GldA n=1 Tax=Taibaiella koreensis TaxID=1268548 RepID=UPI000E59C5AA|nr:gliding motility-associated ABC transporter ATP-binding subunit GldA [Taibaiella koreensis]